MMFSVTELKFPSSSVRTQSGDIITANTMKTPPLYALVYIPLSVVRLLKRDLDS